MFGDDTVDEIYASHVLEYFSRSEATDVLKEWNRVLKPGGILRLSVPDFHMIACVYMRNRNLAQIHGPIYGNIEVDGEDLWHRTIYDEASLSASLLAAGFHHIRRWKWKKFFQDGYDDCSAAYVPHMDTKNGTLISLNLIAEKVC